MTCLEKLNLEHPDLVQWAKDNFDLEYFGCPHLPLFKYAGRPFRCDPREGCFISCKDCWNRELSEWEEKTYDLL